MRETSPDRETLAFFRLASSRTCQWSITLGERRTPRDVSREREDEGDGRLLKGGRICTE